MKSKTQTIIICLLLTLASIQFVSCKKNGSGVINAAKASIADNSIADSTTDSTLNKGMVAWYTFNGDVKDHSGHHNDIIYNTAKPVKGKGGVGKTAYLFDGFSSYMQAANSASLSPLKITLYALIKPKDFYQGLCHGNYVISKEYSGNDNGRYVLGFDDQAYHNYAGCYDTVAYQYENFYGTYGDAGGAASGATDITEFVKLNHWYSVVYTFDGVYSKLYVNGTLVNKVVKSTTFNANSNPLFIGRNEDPNFPYYFNGIIDEIRIYKIVLNANQVLELYNSTNN